MSNFGTFSESDFEGVKINYVMFFSGYRFNYLRS